MGMDCLHVMPWGLEFGCMLFWQILCGDTLGEIIFCSCNLLWISHLSFVIGSDHFCQVCGRQVNLSVDATCHGFDDVMPRISITGKKKPALADSPRFMHNLPSVHPSKMIYILKSGRLLWKFPSRFFSFLPLWWTKGCFNCSLADLGTKPRQNLGRLEKMLEPFLFLRNIGFYVGFALLVLWHDVPM